MKQFIAIEGLSVSVGLPRMVSNANREERE